jgi:hypothetical protein
MTAEAATSDAPIPIPRSPRRQWWIAIVLPAVFVGVAQLCWHFGERRQKQIDQITQSGGHVQIGIPVWDRIVHWMRGTGYPITAVDLNGPVFDDAWLSANSNLDAIPIWALDLVDSPLSDEAISRLLREQRLHVVAFTGCPNVGQETIAALNEQEQLAGLSFDGIALSDDDIADLPLDQLLSLSIRGTQVTPAGLERLSRCRRLSRLTIGGEQLNEESATILRSLPALQYLYVADMVTDEQVRLLHGMMQLEVAYFDTGTDISKEARRDLERSIPGCSVVLW